MILKNRVWAFKKVKAIWKERRKPSKIKVKGGKSL